MSLARLDRLYCFKHQTNVFKSCCITPVSFSDHRMVQCSLFLSSVKPRSAYWHFNNALLSDKDFKDGFEFFGRILEIQSQLLAHYSSSGIMERPKLNSLANSIQEM